MKMIVRVFLILLALFVSSLVVARLVVKTYAAPRTYSFENAPSAPVAIVFGAGLRRDGSPTAVLRDRVQTAADLYLQGKVQKILVSGDNRFLDYNEPGAMADYAIQLGVPQEDVVLDYAGRRTYDTCYRAGYIFGVSKALLVTQSFHLPRAIYTCSKLGLDVVGVSADRRTYHLSSLLIWDGREIPASLVALWQLWVSHPVPVLGEPEPIFGITEDSTAP